jgi:sugar-specific transcriptional regulator TrmB
MSDEKTKKILSEIGLSDNEATIYLAALKSGPTTALYLSKASGIKRTTVYAALESLRERGLVHTQTKGFKRLFAPENPEKLESVLENRKRLLRGVLPELSALYFKLESDEGFIRHYKGLSGIKRVYDQLLKELKPKDFYLVISDQQKWISRDPKYFERFKQERAKMDLSIRLILQDSPSARSNKPIQSRYNEQIKILPRKYELASNMVIVPHKVIMVQTVEPIMALVIENKSVVQMNKALFEMLWESVAE